MVGIVIVSHSSKVAEGIVDLCEEMSMGKVKMKAAGGTGDGRIGTDATKIFEAIEMVDDGDGVLILVDMGSAVMSAELAIELLDEDIQKRVKIADAPILEGSIGSVVQASTGSSLEEVKKVAEQSRNITKI